MQNLEKIQSLIDSSEYEQAASLFLELTKTELSVNFKRFGPMSWDRDGQSRNVFEFVLKRGKKTYKSEFGASVVDSCKRVSRIENDETHELYVGYTSNGSTPNKKFYFSRQIKFTTEQIRECGAADFSDLAERLKNDATNEIEDYLKRINFDKLPSYLKYHKTRIEAQKKLLYGDFSALIRNRLSREFEKLSKEMTYSQKVQEKIEKPTNYDILSCLSIDYFQDVDEVADTFGEMKPSQAIAIFKQDAKLRAFFTDEEEQQMLNAIS